MAQDLRQWTIDDLKAELEKRELSQKGDKESLVGRLNASNDAQSGANGQSNTEEEEEQVAADLIKLEDSPPDEQPSPDSLKSKIVAKALAPVKAPNEEGDSKNEWETMHVPDNWLPIPLFLVRNVPIKAGVTEADVRAAVEAAVQGLKVRSVAFDDRHNESILNRRTAFVRLEGLRPTPKDASAQAADQSLPKEETKPAKPLSQAPENGDAIEYANWAVAKLKGKQPAITVGGEHVQFEIGSSQQVQLYIGNLSPDWQQDEAFEKAMATYGPLERVFIVRNGQGQSKGYGFVEYTLPSHAVKCKAAMDEIERDMRPDPRAMKMANMTKQTKQSGESKITEAQKLAGWQEGGGVVIKLLRAEWAIIKNIDVIFSRVLYVANLRTSPGSQKQLKELFSQYGEVEDVSVPKNKQTQTTKGFAFILFHSGLSADRAYRALEKSGTAEIGGALVSFANAAKHAESRPPATGANNFKAMQPAYKGNAPQGRGSQMSGRGGGPGRMPPPPGRGAPASGGMAGGRGMGRGFGQGQGVSVPGFEAPIMDPFQQPPPMQLQANLAAQNELQERMAAQLRMQQAAQAAQAQTQIQNQMQSQFQQQLRQQQLQMQQMQQQLELSQRQIQQVQAKAQAEAEARVKLEEEARLAALAASKVKREPGYGGMPGEAAAGRGGQVGYGGYHGGMSSAMASKYGSQGSGAFGEGPGYGAGTSQGYGGSRGAGGSQNLPSAPSTGGSQGHGAYDSYGGGAGSYGQDYEGAGYGGYGAGGGDPGYEGGYDERYGMQSGYGYGEAGYGGAAEASHGYSASEYGSEYAQGGNGGYGEAAGYSRGAGGYAGQSASGKRANPYQGSYGSYGGTYGSQGGEAGKRQRY